MVARAKQTFSRAKLAPTAEGTGTVEAGPRNSAIYEYPDKDKCGQCTKNTATQKSCDEAYQVIVASSSSYDIWHRSLAFPNESHKLEDDA